MEVIIVIVLSNTIAQTIQSGQSLTFNTKVLHTGCAECYRNGSGSVGLRANNGVYDCSFKANIASSTAASPIQLALQMDGSPLLETTMISTPSAVDTFNNVSCRTFVSTCCCNGGGTITVVNTGEEPIVVDANPSLVIKRVA